MASCASCGQKVSGGFSLRLRLCGLCQQSKTLQGNLDSKTPVRPINEEDEKK